ncbi:hypothetical protein HOT12_gp13 [Burkholderia phage vB_BmuP_KL4]|uniref:Uncharacterized protein n=2 Tax=root TaxID=1 RepID=A0A2S1GNA9_9CAUD|nr:hypothetical protein HOT12_gp13 [Burkholderia phage vB_BmuP_KL4]AWD90843.1 hypothetical protein [Burkholderia phage vB_BmuP_KL4]EED98613.1 hypothetical protein BURMUCGD1_2185 [Burkholderia multivorans CGD1]PRF54672.1 hypothetical protein C6Q15_28330 [Burkholderia multivorans]
MHCSDEFFGSFAGQQIRHHQIAAGTELLGELRAVRMGRNKQRNRDLKCCNLSFESFEFGHRSFLS